MAARPFQNAFSSGRRRPTRPALLTAAGRPAARRAGRGAGGAAGPVTGGARRARAHAATAGAGAAGACRTRARAARARVSGAPAAQAHARAAGARSARAGAGTRAAARAAWARGAGATAACSPAGPGATAAATTTGRVSETRRGDQPETGRQARGRQRSRIVFMRRPPGSVALGRTGRRYDPAPHRRTFRSTTQLPPCPSSRWHRRVLAARSSLSICTRYFFTGMPPMWRRRTLGVSGPSVSA